MSNNTQQLPFKNAACENQRLAVKLYLRECTEWWDRRKNIISMVIWKSFELGKLIKFLKEKGLFEDITAIEKIRVKLNGWKRQQKKLVSSSDFDYG